MMTVTVTAMAVAAVAKVTAMRTVEAMVEA